MKPRVLAIGFNIRGTGLARVMHGILRRLSGIYEIHFLGLGYSGSEIEDGGMRIYPTNLRGGDALAARQAGEFIRRTKPEIVLIVHDIWMFANHAEAFRPIHNLSRFVGYVPLDGNLTDENLALSFDFLDTLVVYTEWARDEVEGAFERLRANGEPAVFPTVDVVGHGVDRSIFHPLPALESGAFRREDRAGAKARVFPDLPDRENSFIVLNANRQDARKRIDLTIAGFAEFAQDKPPNVRLCLHHPFMGDKQMAHLDRWLDEYQVRDRVHLNPLSPSGEPVSDESLNLLYNACDVGINTCMGEGWGLVSFEHAAAGAAQVVPRHSSCAELWEGGAAEFLEVVETVIPPFTPLEMQSVSARGVAESLERLYRDPDALAELAARSFRRASRPELDWANLAKEWDGIFRRLIETRG